VIVASVRAFAQTLPDGAPVAIDLGIYPEQG
jgi:hypothetical protein